MAYGNGITLTRTWDESYQLTSATEGNLRQVTYKRDHTGNITGITHPANPMKNQAFTYDDLYRLTRAQGPYGNIGYTYDKTGNRLSKTHNEYADTYSYIPGTNRIDEVKGTHPEIYTHDSNGNAFSISGLNLDGPAHSTAQYLYDAGGLRLKKTKDGTVTFYLYDISGNLIAEADAAGILTRSYYYMDGMRLAAADKDGNLYYFHSNHLETPAQMTGEGGKVVWAADYLPFGKANVTIETIRNDFRFPGQAYDAETGYHYNWNRYYSPGVGRYLTADPIGQAGGINVYAYVQNNPINWVDPNGLKYQYVGLSHDTSDHTYISYKGKRVATMINERWYKNDGTLLNGNRSSIMVEYENKGEMDKISSQILSIAKDLGTTAAWAEIVEVAKYNINPGVAALLDALGYLLGASDANAPEFEHDFPCN